MPYPDFLGIGAQKAGTEWLSTNLSRHPQIWMPPLKELHYFDERIKEPSFGALVAKLSGKKYTADWYRRFLLNQFKWNLQRHQQKFEVEKALWDLRFFVLSPSDRWYASLFKQAGERITGEITPGYSVLEEDAIAHVHDLMPDAKLILLLRNPIERVYSSAVMYLDIDGQDPQTATDEMFLDLFEWRGSKRTRYAQILERWRKYYSDEQIFVGFLEDIHFYPDRMIARLYRFLGVDTSFAQKVKRGKIHSRSRGTMPTRLAVQLARTYYDELHDLSLFFGGNASFWLYCAEKLIAGAVAEDLLPYPLWNSQFRDEWVSDSSWKDKPQSGPLASIILR